MSGTGLRFARTATAILLLAALAACQPQPAGYTGYVEGESVRVAAPVAGRLTLLSVARGQQVKEGDALFTLEQEREEASVSQAALDIKALAAQVDQAQAQEKLARANLQRLLGLKQRQGLVSQEDLDRARAELDAARARSRQVAAQQKAAQAQLSQVQWQLTQKTVAAPVAGLVEDTIYRVGEWVPSGAPVVSLLPPANRVIRFFVPEAAVGALKMGQGVRVHCDGCAAPVAATVSFIAPQAEYTPPVIYSRDARTKLVFLVEARAPPEVSATLHPGQPVDVELDGQ